MHARSLHNNNFLLSFNITVSLCNLYYDNNSKLLGLTLRTCGILTIKSNAIRAVNVIARLIMQIYLCCSVENVADKNKCVHFQRFGSGRGVDTEKDENTMCFKYHEFIYVLNYVKIFFQGIQLLR